VAYKAGASEAEIGGDFYDVFEMSTGRVALILGDVCGKGLPAATQVAMLRNMLRYVIYNSETSESPDSLPNAVAQLNSVLVSNKLLADFATVFIGLYDPGKRQLEFVSCGHEPAIVIRKGAATRVEMLPPTGPVLGVTIGLPMRSSHVDLRRGDSLVIYSDGLVERGSHRCELLGVARVIHSIHSLNRCGTADDIARTIYASIPPGPDEATDDVCLLVAQTTHRKGS